MVVVPRYSIFKKLTRWLYDATQVGKGGIALKSGSPVPLPGEWASVLIMCIHLFFRDVGYN